MMMYYFHSTSLYVSAIFILKIFDCNSETEYAITKDMNAPLPENFNSGLFAKGSVNLKKTFFNQKSEFYNTSLFQKSQTKNIE